VLASSCQIWLSIPFHIDPIALTACTVITGLNFLSAGVCNELFGIGLGMG
jgi:hypothetical protein